MESVRGPIVARSPLHLHLRGFSTLPPIELFIVARDISGRTVSVHYSDLGEEGHEEEEDP
jgi:hypothetical protein